MTDILRYSKQLEFDKVCALAAEYAVSSDARVRVLNTVPCRDIAEAAAQLDITRALFTLVVRGRPPAIVNVSGIGEICMRAEKGGALSMSELLSVARALKNARVLLSWRSSIEQAELDVLSELFYSLYENQGFERVIDESILSDTEMADTASAALAAIRKRILRAELSIKEKLDSLVRKSDTSKLLQDAIVTMRAGRYVVPVKNEHKNEIKGLVHDVSSSGGTYFVEPEAVVEANNLIVTLKGEESAEIERILYRLSAEVADFSDRLKESYEAFLNIDTALAKARYALSTDAVAPEFSKREVNLKKARHPLIPKDRVVPTDIIVGREYSSLVITGPNTGGKTVTLKTVGLLTLMAMSGMMIPVASGSTVRLFTRVLVDIGDEQSIAQNLSTFSGHMKNIASILEAADGDSLVLLDELGAGTDPAEGAALAIAILERLRRQGSTVIATTHYGEIKLYAMETDGVQNASCEFDVATLSPTYRISIGIPGMSNALLICERLGLDAEVIAAARRNMSRETRSFEEVLAQIERIKSETADKLDEADRYFEDAKKQLRDAQNERDSIKRQADTELSNAKSRAKQLVADVSAKAYALQDEIRKLDKDKERDRDRALARAKAIAKNESSRLLDMTDPVGDTDMTVYEPVTEPAVGMRVVLVELRQLATIQTLPDKNGVVEVLAGSIKTRVPLEKLGVVPKNTADKKQKPVYTPKDGADTGRSTKTEINLLGMTVEEAILEVDRFLDEAVRAKLTIVYLIHGRGTGALRAGLHMHLKKQKQIKSFRLGRYGEGEDGVTVVELK